MTVMVLHGEDDFLIEDAWRALQKDFLGGDRSELNFERFDDAPGLIEKMVLASQSLPMLGGKKMIVVSQPSFLMKAGSDDRSAGQGWNRWLKPVHADQRVLLVMIVIGKFDRRLKAVQHLISYADCREFHSFKPWQRQALVSWLTHYARRFGKIIHSGAAEMMVEIGGTNARALSTEIEKLAVYVGDSPHIRKQDVEEVVSVSGNDVFQLMEAVRRRHVQSAVACLHRSLEQHEDPLLLLGVIASQFRLLLQVKALAQRKMSQKQIATLLGKNPYYIGQLWPHLDQYQRQDLRDGLCRLSEADFRIKTGVSAAAELELTVLDTLERSRGGSGRI